MYVQTELAGPVDFNNVFITCLHSETSLLADAKCNVIIITTHSYYVFSFLW